jgi:hypothetical protein
MKVVLTLTAFVLCGCAAPKIWNKTGATQSDFASDSYACEKDSRQSGYFGGGIAGQINMQNFFDRCMVAHGWSQSSQPKTYMDGSARVNNSEPNVQGIGSKYSQ